jgi:hypothetical protein
MKQISVVRSVDPLESDDLFISCASFEDRCLGMTVYGGGYACKDAVLIRFRTKRPNSIQDRRRAANFEEIYKYLISKSLRVYVLDTERHNPHSLSLSLEDVVATVAARTGPRMKITVDISCFTRVQLLFTLRRLFAIRGAELRILYSVPTYYGSLENKELAFDYDRMLMLPFSLGNYGAESLSPDRVLVISLGHEGGRSLYAWRYLDPKFTTLIYPGSRHSPDLFAVVMRSNRQLIQRLEMGDPSFKAVTIDSHDIESARNTCSEIIEDVERSDGSRALYFVPGGPKPISVGLAMATCTAKAPVYIAYPVPRTYSNAYSAGLARMLEHRIQTSDLLGVEAAGSERIVPASAGLLKPQVAS